MKKVTGIGGIFFKCNDPNQMKDWYKEQLGLDTNEWGAMFQSRDIDNANQVNHLQWSTFPNDSKYMEPSKASFMINYRVADLVGLEKELRAAGVTICDEIAEYEYGKFLHILDPEGNKIELWEPIDSGF
ncbi:MAG: VOC family protein [Crocinitomicaceae bacterium]|nr:VOC family protein [Crocinitomicaceae bacterium]